MISRLFALVMKEIITLLRDPKGRMVLIFPPLMQLLIFAYAVTLDVKDADVVVYNQDSGKHGYEILQRLHGAPTFSKMSFVQTHNQVKKIIDQQKALLAIVIPQDFSMRIEERGEARLQSIFDGRRSNAAQIVSGYLSSIINDYNQELTADSEVITPEVKHRYWFNENLIYLWFTAPSLVGVLSMLITLSITALSISRERELGTFDQLMVSPLSTYEILIGKTIPAILIGMLEGLMILFVARWGFGIPFHGSMFLAILSLFIFNFSVVGVGLFVSSLSHTQQQALLGGFTFMVPAVTLSGYSAPIENMPMWLQYATNLDPLKHFLIIIKGLFLKAMPFAEVWRNTWPLLIIGVVSLTIAGLSFHRRVE